MVVGLETLGNASMRAMMSWKLAWAGRIQASNAETRAGTRLGVGVGTRAGTDTGMHAVAGMGMGIVSIFGPLRR